jgi:hypothetical protein
MSADDVAVDLEGFDSKSNFGSFLKGIVGGLSLEAPSNSAIKAVFKNQGHVITGTIEIQSSEGLFSANAEGRNSRETALRICREIRTQLRYWKKRRRVGRANFSNYGNITK